MSSEELIGGFEEI
jgi:hypothetical protein